MLLVIDVTGPTRAEVGDTVEYKVLEFTEQSPSPGETAKVNWQIVANNEVIEDLEHHGPTLSFTISPAFAGKSLRVMPYMSSPSIRVSVLTRVQEDASTVVTISGPEPATVGDVPFATSNAGNKYWPIVTNDHGGREVAYMDVNNRIHGRSGRRFLASRSSGRRYHVGVDLWGNAGDLIVACEPGVIVNSYHFYSGTYALFLQCDSGIVINFGEVRANSHREFGLDIGSKVDSGAPIARVGQMRSGSSMCHFETYTNGTTTNKRWMVDDPRPSALLNPTKYLLELAQYGA